MGLVVLGRPSNSPVSVGPLLVRLLCVGACDGFSNKFLTQLIVLTTAQTAVTEGFFVFDRAPPTGSR